MQNETLRWEGEEVSINEALRRKGVQNVINLNTDGLEAWLYAERQMKADVRYAKIMGWVEYLLFVAVCGTLLAVAVAML
jgi:hypothetical protein